MGILVGFGSVTYAVHLLPAVLDTSICTLVECVVILRWYPNGFYVRIAI